MLKNLVLTPFGVVWAFELETVEMHCFVTAQCSMSVWLVVAVHASVALVQFFVVSVVTTFADTFLAFATNYTVFFAFYAIVANGTFKHITSIWNRNRLIWIEYIKGVNVDLVLTFVQFWTAEECFYFFNDIKITFCVLITFSD